MALQAECASLRAELADLRRQLNGNSVAHAAQYAGLQVKRGVLQKPRHDIVWRRRLAVWLLRVCLVMAIVVVQLLM